MSNAIKLIAASKYKNSFRDGYPLVTEESVQRIPKGIEEGAVIELTDESGRFIGKGYYGKQNKGRGWLLSRNPQETFDEAFFAKKFQEALRRREALFRDPDTTAFRVFNGEGDGIGGITIDNYDGFYVISWYSEGIYTFRDTVIQAFMNSTDVKGLYEKKRFAVKGTYIEDDDFAAGERASFPLMVKENGISFPIYLNDGAMVGVFLDQRHVRKTIRDKYAEGKTVLNTFSYTGAFSAAAALGGAEKTTSVDLANRSKSKTIEMFSVNGIDFEAQDIIVEDVFNYFKYAVRKQLTFDMVILDPPSFARSKKHTFSARKDYPELLAQAIQITEKNGIIVASSNCSTFNMKKFKDFIKKAFAQTGERYKILEEFTLPEDFRTIKEFKEGDYLKVAFIQKL
ncbi:50S rRNA methyltransferase [Cytobacillus firmus]|uniref:Putative ribosomal RNA large subunit methyltransferase YwbD n=2 Tax=Bacillaceae TaxID=186817 RepID=A0A380XGB2_CYTFI|nr:class I SAM-dependent rRNA methyltransferase [Cytobacillus firmus]KAF0825486.1 putative ribosomal RNA large subunit methyltransferase YwbD [Cytobacillus firmus]MBG9542842.1 50S rRNA methyltransferase [Cytobacillus firmus]MBG9554275.1 50S rRNA methyltransferase [Cytobacillus firmus]MBG9557058.1 50S rRNA methyltransferase [Cytobacillus firmus]MBG9576564.1 50S rRNA methyltransferase [Cytobacillus firmus]